MGPTRFIEILSGKLSYDEVQEIIIMASDHGWTLTEDYIKNFLQTEENKILRIFQNDRLAAFLCHSHYKMSSWVGFSLTRPELRGHGLNKRLKSFLLSTIKDIPTFLVCGNHLLAHNSSVGFKFLGKLFELTCFCCGSQNQAEDLKSIYVDKIATFDRVILGGVERQNKLQRILNLEDSYLFHNSQKGALSSYGIISRINKVYRVGPLVFDNIESGLELLKQILNTKILYGEKIVLHVFEPFLKEVLENFQQLTVKTEYNLMGTMESSVELEKQLVIYGRATG